jgi:hypothetical protein
MTDPFKETGEHYTSLNEHHQMGRARDINANNLRDHLVLYHSVSAQNVRTKAELGRLHTLVHAVLAHPELGDLMNVPEGWGK